MATADHFEASPEDERLEALLVGGDHAPEQGQTPEERHKDHRPYPTMQTMARGGARQDPIQFDYALRNQGSTYPLVFELPGGKLFVHFGAESRLLNLAAPDFATAEAIPTIDRRAEQLPCMGPQCCCPSVRPTLHRIARGSCS